MKSFKLNGVSYLNGYQCDSKGRPITMKNGYSSEDEKEAHEAYLEALEIISRKETSVSKYTTKTQIDEPTGEELMALLEEAHNARKRSQNGFMLNDAGEEISVENGYTDKDETFTKRQVKSLSL